MFCSKPLNIYPHLEFRGPPISGNSWLLWSKTALAIPLWLPRMGSKTLDPATSKIDQTIGEWEHAAETSGFSVIWYDLETFGRRVPIQDWWFRGRADPGLMRGTYSGQIEHSSWLRVAHSGSHPSQSTIFAQSCWASTHLLSFGDHRSGVRFDQGSP